MKFIKKFMRKGGTTLVAFLVGVFASDLVKPQLEKLPIVGDFVSKIDDVVEGLVPDSAPEVEEEE